MAAGGQRDDELRRVGRRPCLVDPEPGAGRRIELNPDRTGIRYVDLALDVKDLLAGLCRQLVERQGAGYSRIGGRPATWLGIQDLVAKCVVSGIDVARAGAACFKTRQR